MLMGQQGSIREREFGEHEKVLGMERVLHNHFEIKGT